MSLLPFRYITFLLTVVFTVLGVLLTRSVSPWWLILAVPCGLLSVLGVYDLIQTRHAIRRNYPVLGNLRFLLEFIRPEIRQYFLEDDTQAAPFSRAKRSIVYQRAPSKRSISGRSAHKKTFMATVTNGSTILWCPPILPTEISVFPLEARTAHSPIPCRSSIFRL